MILESIFRDLWYMFRCFCSIGILTGVWTSFGTLLGAPKQKESIQEFGLGLVPALVEDLDPPSRIQDCDLSPNPGPGPGPGSELGWDLDSRMALKSRSGSGS